MVARSALGAAECGCCRADHSGPIIPEYQPDAQARVDFRSPTPVPSLARRADISGPTISNTSPTRKRGLISDRPRRSPRLHVGLIFRVQPSPIPARRASEGEFHIPHAGPLAGASGRYFGFNHPQYQPDAQARVDFTSPTPVPSLARRADISGSTIPISARRASEGEFQIAHAGPLADEEISFMP